MRAKCASVGGLNEESRMAMRIGRLGIVVCGGSGHVGYGTCASSIFDELPWTRAKRESAVSRKVTSWSIVECRMMLISDLFRLIEPWFFEI